MVKLVSFFDHFYARGGGKMSGQENIYGKARQSSESDMHSQRILGKAICEGVADTWRGNS